MTAQGAPPSMARRRSHPPDIDTVLYESPLLRIGRWRCPASHPWFVNSGPVAEACFVFPREPVWIAHEHERPFVADANTVTYYNTGQCYERRRLGDRGDRCEWFALADDAMRDSLAAVDPDVRGRDERPFTFTHGPADPASYLLQRTIVEHVRREVNPDRLFVEESALQVFARVTAMACREGSAADGPRPGRSRVDLAEAARSHVARRFEEGFSLTDLARALGTSVFHLSRIFHAQTGFTLHAYRTELRLRAALERIGEPGADLMRVALDLGFSSHSHFAESFRRKFGQTPSAFRKGPGPNSPKTMQFLP
jgi:AraC-like DNA-binding protein